VIKQQQLGRQFADVVKVVGWELGKKERNEEDKHYTFLLCKPGIFSKEAMAL
jgi:hypothetical protein